MAGRIPQIFIDELLARADIVDLIEGFVPLKKRGKEYVACCPFHNEKTPSFTVSQTKQFYHCFGCGAHGTALGFLMDYERLDFVDAVEHLARQVGLEVPREGQIEKPYPHRTDDYELLNQAALFFKQQLKNKPEAIEYLKGRGLNGQIAKNYRLGFAPNQRDGLIRYFQGQAELDDLVRTGLVIRKDNDVHYDRFRKRIMFPIRDRQGRVIGFGGRVLDDGTPKYLNSPETALFHKSHALYGFYEARKAQSKLDRIIVVEGYMDVIALAQHGVLNAVATLGTATSRNHIGQLFRQTNQVVFCFDGDRAGREAAWRVIEPLFSVFQDGWDARFLFLPEGQDPDSQIRKLGAESFLQRAQSAKTLSDFFFERLGKDMDLNTDTGRARLAEQVKPLWSNLTEGVFKQLMFERLEKHVHINPQQLQRLTAETSSVYSNVQSVPQRQSISPVRQAITLIFSKPSLVEERKPNIKTLGQLELPGIKLLVEVIEIFQSHPKLTASAVIERFRDSEHHKHLLKLMEWQPPNGLDYEFTAEFNDVMTKLYTLQVDLRTDELIQKERDSGLNHQEKRELYQLLVRTEAQ